MLGKLIGYEMKAFGRVLLPLYAALIVLSVMAGVGLRVLPKSVTQGAGFGIIGLLIVLLIMAVILMTVILSIGRFYSNLLGREGYLMFSLPTGTGSLIWAKVISSVIWTCLGTLTAVLAIGAVSLGTVNSSIGEMFSIFGQAFSHIGVYKTEIIMTIIMIIAMIVCMIVRVYAAIAIGHQWSDHRVLGSIFAYVGIRIIETILLSVTGEKVFNSGFNFASQISSYPVGIDVELIVMAAVGILIYGVITWLLLDRRLNLE